MADSTAAVESWAARLEAADVRLAELQAQLDLRDAMLQQGSARTAIAQGGHTTRSFPNQTLRSPLVSPTRPSRLPMPAHTSPQQAAAAVAAAAASEAAEATVAAARAAIIAQSSAEASASLAAAAPAAATTASPGRSTLPALHSIDDSALVAKQAQLEAALVRAKQMGALLQSKGTGLKAELRQAKASQVAAEAVAQAKDDLLQVRQQELAEARTELERAREDLTQSKLAQGRLQTECQALQVRLAGHVNTHQALEADLAYARAELAGLRAELSQLKGTEMVQRALTALGGVPAPLSPGTTLAMAGLRDEASALATEVRSLRESQRAQHECQARLQATCDTLRQENSRLQSHATRADAAQEQMQQVLGASHKLQEALSVAVSSLDTLRARCSAAESQAAEAEFRAQRAERENRTLRDQLRTVLTQVEELAELQRVAAVASVGSRASASPHSMGDQSHSSNHQPPSSGASAPGVLLHGSGHAQDKDHSWTEERYKQLTNTLRAVQAELAAHDPTRPVSRHGAASVPPVVGPRTGGVMGSGGAGATSGAGVADPQVAQLQEAVSTALDQLRQQQALTRARVQDRATEQDKERLAVVSAELAAKTTELVRHRADLEKAAQMMEDSQAVQAQLAEQLQRTTLELQRLQAHNSSLPPARPPQPVANSGLPRLQGGGVWRDRHSPSADAGPPPQAAPTHSTTGGGQAAASHVQGRYDPTQGSQPSAYPNPAPDMHAPLQPEHAHAPGQLRVVVPQSQGAQRSLGDSSTSSSDDDLGLLLEYMEHELAQLSGGLADREAMSHLLLKRMSAVKQLIQEGQQPGSRPRAAPHPHTVPAVWDNSSPDSRHAQQSSPTGTTLPPFFGAPLSGQCSPDASVAHSTHTTQAGGGGGRDSRGQGSSWGAGTSSRHESSPLYESHSTYTVPTGATGAAADSSTAWGQQSGERADGRAAAGSNAGLNVQRLLADAADVVAAAGSARGQGGGARGGGVRGGVVLPSGLVSSEVSSSTVLGAVPSRRVAFMQPVGAASSNYRSEASSTGEKLLRTYQSMASVGGEREGSGLDHSVSMARSVAGVDHALAALQAEETYTD